MELLKAQFALGEGISACDGYLVFSDQKVPLGNGDYTEVMTDSLDLTGEGFMKLMLKLMDRYVWREYEFVVRVDPQTLLFPNQLKSTIFPNLLWYQQTQNGTYWRTCGDGSASVSPSLELIGTHALVKFGLGMRKQCMAEAVGLSEEEALEHCMSLVQATPLARPFSGMTGTCKSQPTPLRTPPPFCSFAQQAFAFYPLKSVEEINLCAKQLVSPELIAQVPMAAAAPADGSGAEVYVKKK